MTAATKPKKRLLSPQEKIVSRKQRNILIKKHIPFYLFLLLPILHVTIFTLFPIYGVTIAFKDFKMARGIAASDWIGFANFQKMFADPIFWRVFFNTLKISFLTLLLSFPATIVFALLVNELTNLKFKKLVQTITYMPHFLSWIVVGTFVFTILSPTNGIINSILMFLGVIDEPLYFMVEPSKFIPIYLITTLWKTTGYGIIIYLSTISSIDTTLYESAMIDGANRFQRILYITLPSIAPVVSTMLILNISSLISVGFDPIFNLYTPSTYEVADVLSTYVYRRGMLETQYSLTTAIGLFQNLIGFALIIFSNWLARKANPDYRVI